MRKPLGRGLDALIGGAASTATHTVEPVAIGTIAVNGGESAAQEIEPREGRFAMIPADRIERGKFQPRLNFNEAALEELRRAIVEQGIVEPLIVRRIELVPGGEGPRFELIAGERRLRAARAAGLAAVPAIVRNLDDRAALEMSLVENIAREGLNAVEEALAFRRLAKSFSLSHEQIAERIGKSRPYVTNQLRLLDLPQEVIDMIAGGRLTAGQARPLLAMANAQRQIAAARKMIEDGGTARTAEREARERAQRSERRAAEGTSSDPNTMALAETLRRTLKRKVRIMRRRGRTPGRIEIDYYDDNDLTALADMLIGNSRAASARM